MSDTDNKAGLLALSVSAGYLCCLAGFEMSRVWDFSPFPFRPGMTLMLAAGFCASFLLYREALPRTSLGANLLVAWSAVTGWPFLSENGAVFGFFATALVLLSSNLVGRLRLTGIACAVGMAASLKLSMITLPMGMILLLVTWFEVRGPRRVGDGSPGADIPRAEMAKVEISWVGFSSLFQRAVPGEGERFTSSVLNDTQDVIRACGGCRLKGSDLNGLYGFPNQSALDQCLDALDRYRIQIVEVLEQAKAPPLELKIERR